MRPLRNPTKVMNTERGVMSKRLRSLITHYSSLTTILSPRAEKFLHQPAAFFFQHAGGNFNAMVQEVGVANSEVRFNRSGPFVARAIHQPFDSRLYQSARTHYARFNR